MQNTPELVIGRPYIRLLVRNIWSFANGVSPSHHRKTHPNQLSEERKFDSWFEAIGFFPAFPAKNDGKNDNNDDDDDDVDDHNDNDDDNNDDDNDNDNDDDDLKWIH